jgi:hypothetical protein
MNCVEVTETLDRMIFEEVLTDVEISEHLEGCAACRRAYLDTLKAREMMNLIRRSEPVLKNPDENAGAIMDAIRKQPRKKPVVLPLIKRLLAAAAVACFIILGYEQYQVVKKVSALEIQFRGTRPVGPYPDPFRHPSALDINKAGISFSEVERLLKSGKGTTPLSLFIIKKRLEKSKIK